MKFKEQRGSVFVFDGGEAGGELELDIVGSWFKFKGYLLITKELKLKCNDSLWATHTDIQTAVKLMQILINEGLV